MFQSRQPLRNGSRTSPSPKAAHQFRALIQKHTQEEEELRGRELEKHARDLGGEGGAEGLDAREEPLAELLVVVRQPIVGSAFRCNNIYRLWFSHKIRS